MARRASGEIGMRAVEIFEFRRQPRRTCPSYEGVGVGIHFLGRTAAEDGGGLRGCFVASKRGASHVATDDDNHAAQVGILRMKSPTPIPPCLACVRVRALFSHRMNPRSAS